MSGKRQTLVLKKDLVIPRGTRLQNIDGVVSEFVQGNFEAMFGLTDDSFGRLIYSIDADDEELTEWFEEEEDV